MTRLGCFIALCLCCVGLPAQTVNLSLHDAPLSEALRRIDQGQQERRIVFVFNEMERFRVSCELSQLEPLEAVRQVCSSLPIRIKTKGRYIFVEAEQPKTQRTALLPSPYLKPLDEVRVLDEVTVVRKRIRYGANGYTAQIEARGMKASEALTYLPNLIREDNHLYVHGQVVSQIFLDGMPISTLDELDQLQGDMIEEVRIDYQPCVIHIALRQPDEGGYYGSLYSELIGQGEYNDMGELGAVCYLRHQGISLYNRFAFEGSNRTEEVENSYHYADNDFDYLGDTQSRHGRLSDRVSINYEPNRHHALGASLYLSYDWNSAESAMKQRKLTEPGREYYFEGENEHADTELTLKYTHTFGPRNGTLDVLLDVFDRSAQTENLSLYGAGVGTELGESPSITLWRGLAELRQPLTDQTALLYRLDLRRFHTLYDPDRYNTNFLGAPAVTQQIDQHGQMIDAGIDVQHAWDRLQLSGGIGAKINRVESKPGNGDYSQRQLTPHLRIELPLGTDNDRHRIALMAQRQLDDIPYAALSPAIRWNDAFNFTMGNTALRAPLSSQLMLHAALWQGKLNVSTAYRWVEDEIYWQTFVAKGQTEVFYTQPVNVGNLRIWSMQGELNLHPAAWWQMKATTQLHLRSEDATLAKTHYDGQHLQQRYTLDNHLRFDGHWTASLHADLEPRHSIYDRTYHTTYIVSGELQKGWMDNRLLTTLLFVPLGQNRQIDRQIDGRNICYKYCTTLQQLGLRVVWNFNSGRRIKVGTVEGGQRFEENRNDL